MTPFLDRDLRVKPINAFIDPPQPRERAIITHGHGDHARSGHGAVLATPDTIAIMKVRYGEDSAGRFQALDYGVPLDVDGVRIVALNQVRVVTIHCPHHRRHRGGKVARQAAAERGGRTWRS